MSRFIKIIEVFIRHSTRTQIAAKNEKKIEFITLFTKIFLSCHFFIFPNLDFRSYGKKLVTALQFEMNKKLGFERETIIRYISARFTKCKS